MGLILNTPKIILAETQNIIIDRITISRIRNKEMVAQVYFSIYDEKGVKIGTDSLNYSGLAFNDFWTSFNSGTFLYQKLAQSKDAPIPADGSLEGDLFLLLKANFLWLILFIGDMMSLLRNSLYQRVLSLKSY